MLCSIWYLVFGIRIVRPNSTIPTRYSDFLDTKKYSVFGIGIFSIPASIQYLIFGDFWKLNNIRYSYSVKKRYSSHSDISCVKCHMSPVMCHLPCVPCRLSLTTTATATDPPPGNSPTMHYEKTQKPKLILAVNFFTRSLQSTVWWGFKEGRNFHDIVTYRLN